MSERFFVEQPIEGDSAELIDTEAHHVMHVMRLGVGEEVTLFDGSGREFQATIAEITRRTVRLDILHSQSINRERTIPIVLGVVWPKGDRQRWLVEKACELGVARIVPLITERSDETGRRCSDQKLHRAVIEASKQCRRNKLMEISDPLPVDQFLSDLPGDVTGLLADPGGVAWSEFQRHVQDIRKADEDRPVAMHLAVGPEGGFTEDEVTLAAGKSWTVVDLGPRILRIETAALALVTAATM